MRRDWWVPLAGVAFIAIIFIGMAVVGDPPGADEPVQEIVDYYVDDKDSVMFGALLTGVAAVMLVLYASYLRTYLTAAEGGDSTFPTIAFGGALIMATGAAIDGTLSFAMAEAADDIDPTALQAMQAIWDNDFLPFILGASLLLLGSGVSIVRSGALPKWLGWAAIVFAVVCMTPAGFVGFLAGGLWVLVTSIMLALRLREPVAA